MTTTTPRELTTNKGSIAVYQRMLPDRRPTKVEIIRSVRESYRRPDGKAFGRTNNTVLLRVSSGTDCLAVAEAATLRACGLDEREIRYVNQRLSELAGPAIARTLEMNLVEAKEKLGWIIALAGTSPLVAKQLFDLIHSAAGQLAAGDGDVDTDALERRLVTPSQCLTDALRTLNRSCEQAQSSYKRLPKGELPDDVVLEFQKSWFTYQDLLSTLTKRKSMARPAGWSNLRAQVCAGRIYRKGQPIPDESCVVAMLS